MGRHDLCSDEDLLKTYKSHIMSDQYFQLLVQLYVFQLTEGCSNTNCQYSNCYGCRIRNDSEPPRKLTAVSARAVALSLVDNPDPSSSLCPDSALRWMREHSASTYLTQDYTEASAAPEAIKERLKDPRSFHQFLFDTHSLKSFFSVEFEVFETSSADVLPRGSRSFRITPKVERPPSSVLGNTLSEPFEASLQQAHLILLQSLSQLRRDANGYNLLSALKISSQTLEEWLVTQVAAVKPAQTSNDTYGPALILARRMVDCLTLGNKESEQVPLSTATSNKLSASRSFVKDLNSKVRSSVAGSRRYMCLFYMFQQVLEKDWTGNSIFSPRSSEGRVIALLSLLRRTIGPKAITSAIILPDQNRILERRLDPMKAAISLVEKLNHLESILSTPWLFSARFQAESFRAICLCRMQKAYEDPRLLSKKMQGLGQYLLKTTQVTSLTSDVLPTPFYSSFGFTVHRDLILEDALDQLFHRQERELLRPIRVNLEGAGEVGQDLGGVAQEFFRLALVKVFEPGYGMFVVDPLTKIAWFDPQSLEPSYKYEILGLLTALAVHNGFTLPVNFPLAFYKLLKEEKVASIADIVDGWPELARGLDQLLEWKDGDVADVFARDYVFSFKAYGKVVDINMKNGKVEESQNGETSYVPVTNNNREAFVKDYIVWLTYKSVEVQVEAFKKGFCTVIPRQYLGVVTANVLRRLVEGERVVDIASLKSAAGYDGYMPTHPVIQNFWSVVESFGQERQRQLLEFVTASDRVPVSGLQNIDFVIQRNGDDNGLLPTSFTCFGRLLLPEYKTKEQLEQKLNVALDNSQGFGLR